jgi:hypothetical protein
VAGLPEVERKLADAAAALQRARAWHPAALDAWTGLAFAIGQQKISAGNVKRELGSPSTSGKGE